MSERERFWKDCPLDDGTDRNCVLCENATCRNSHFIPAHPAAGEWRTDVENAPRDNEFVLSVNKYGNIGMVTGLTLHSLADGYAVAWAPIYQPSAKEGER